MPRVSRRNMYDYLQDYLKSLRQITYLDSYRVRFNNRNYIKCVICGRYCPPHRMTKKKYKAKEQIKNKGRKVLKEKFYYLTICKDCVSDKVIASIKKTNKITKRKPSSKKIQRVLPKNSKHRIKFNYFKTNSRRNRIKIYKKQLQKEKQKIKIINELLLEKLKWKNTQENI